MAFPALANAGTIEEVATTVADITPALPAGSGGLLVMLVMSYNAPAVATASAFSTPTDWTKVAEVYNDNTFGDTYRSVAFYTSTTASGDPTITRTGTAGAMAAIIHRFSGASSTLVASNLRTDYRDELRVNVLTDHATDDTLGIILALRPAVAGTWPTPPPPAGWVDADQQDGSVFNAVLGTIQMAGDTSDELVYGIKNTTTAWAELSLSMSAAAVSNDRTADITASLPVPVVAMDAHGSGFTGEDVQVLSENNCTVTISQATTITYAQHRNNAGYGVRCDGTVYVTETTPTPTTVGSGRAMHGVMLSTNTEPDGEHTGFDSDESGHYTDAMNYGPGIESTPLAITPESGHPVVLIKSRSYTTLVNAYPQYVAKIQDAMVVVFYHVDDYPADITNTYRPAYHNTDVVSGLGITYDMLDLSRLRNFDLTALTHPVTSGDATAFTAAIQKVQLEMTKGTWSDLWHPGNHMRNYSRDFAEDWGAAQLLANSTQKNDAVIDALVQLGIDLHGYYLNGGSQRADGGEGMGRCWPIRFAGWLLGDTSMYLLDNDSYPGGDNQSFPTAGTSTLTMQFQEVGNLWWVGAGDINRTTLYTPTYQVGDVGKPEWGLQHYYYPTEDNVTWDGAPGYRRCCTFKSSTAAILADHCMGIPCTEDFNPVDPLSVNPLRLQEAYMDRYITVETGYGTTWLPDDWMVDAWADFLSDVPAASADRTADITATLPVPVVDFDVVIAPAGPSGPSKEADVTAVLPMVLVSMGIVHGRREIRRGSGMGGRGSASSGPMANPLGSHRSPVKAPSTRGTHTFRPPRSPVRGPGRGGGPGPMGPPPSGPMRF